MDAMRERRVGSVGLGLYIACEAAGRVGFRGEFSNLRCADLCPLRT